ASSPGMPPTASALSRPVTGSSTMTAPFLPHVTDLPQESGHYAGTTIIHSKVGHRPRHSLGRASNGRAGKEVWWDEDSARGVAFRVPRNRELRHAAATTRARRGRRRCERDRTVLRNDGCPCRGLPVVP